MVLVALVANDNNEKEPATKQQKVDPTFPATARTSDTTVAEKVGIPDSTVLAGRSSEAQAAANKAAAVRVDNTRMPAALTINPAPVSGGAALRDCVRRAAATFKPKNDKKDMVGTVRIKFIVEADGKLGNLKLCGAYDQTTTRKRYASCATAPHGSRAYPAAGGLRYQWN